MIEYDKILPEYGFAGHKDMLKRAYCSDSKVWSVTDPPKDIYKEFHVIMNVSVQMTEKRMKRFRRIGERQEQIMKKQRDFIWSRWDMRFFSLITAAVLGRSI